MNKRAFYVPFNAKLGYIGTATYEGMKRRMIVLSDIHWLEWTNGSQWPEVSWPATLTTKFKPRMRSHISNENLWIYSKTYPVNKPVTDYK